jgi:hypothetical protein
MEFIDKITKNFPFALPPVVLYLSQKPANYRFTFITFPACRMFLSQVLQPSKSFGKVMI